MKETSLKPVIEKLENLFSKFNEKFYKMYILPPYSVNGQINGLKKKRCLPIYQKPPYRNMRMK